MRPNPIIGPNKLKLGMFCSNGRGNPCTTVPEAHQMTWRTSVETARMADQIGLEAIVPFARWKGFVEDDPGHISGDVMDPFTWAAAISQVTKQASIFVTAHAPTIHPVAAAKQLATIDIVSNGRVGLNVVAGWNRPELEMFGAPLEEHDRRYDHLGEWLSIVSRLWSSDAEFDFEGDFYRVVRGFSLPKPLQRPRPPVMNAGNSERGRDFACANADLCFVTIKSEDPAAIKSEVDGYKTLARERYGRSVQVWTNTFVVQRDTSREAQEYLHYFAVERQDKRAVDSWIERTIANAKGMPPHVLEAIRTRIAAGAGGFPLIGSAADIVARLELLSSSGIDGVLMVWTDYVDGLNRFGADVMPLLVSAGLRGSALVGDASGL